MAYDELIESLNNLSFRIVDMDDARLAIIDKCIALNIWDGYDKTICTITEIKDHLRNLFTVSFFSDGEFKKRESVHYGDSATPPVVSKIGYTLSKWEPSYTKIMEDLNVYAKWTANTYTVNYDGNGADGGSTESSTHTYDVSKELTTNGYTRTNYVFDNWNTKEDGTGTVYTNGQSVLNLATEGSITLYAQWRKSIHFESSTVGTQTLTLPAGTYTIICVGAGAGSATVEFD